jgi:predicted AAA+ superfamily ATPase
MRSKFGYTNFDDERLYGIKARELNSLLQAIYELEGEDIDLFLFDEIQNVPGWELFINKEIQKELSSQEVVQNYCQASWQHILQAGMWILYCTHFPLRS